MESLTYPDIAWLWLIPALPLLGFVLCGLMSAAGSRSPQGASRGLASLIAILMPAGAFGATIAAALTLNGVGMADGATPPALVASGWEWFSLGDVALRFGLHFDALTSLMLLFVTGIGTLIVLYSAGYMAHDRGLCRFMSYLNLFLFAMILLVLGDNLFVTFLGWEGVGLCSYLLIGFWHRDHANNDAARKAFIVNRIGDLGFVLGVFCLLAAMGPSASLAYADISEFFLGSGSVVIGDPARQALATAAALLLFLGCAGKSAQIPLMVWLPDAMAGPTPVSALIHAATMVTAGVFLIARLAALYVITPLAGDVITCVALITAVWAAVAGLFQWDIKKILAYSTVSQLGFMFLAAGLGAYDVALFHVFTHAFFKATLFLGAGSVIHGLHHEQDIRRMGGLAKAMPVTHLCMFAAWWAIIGLPLGSGFFSKDLILEHALFDGNTFVYAVALGAALITAIYMSRLMYYVFWSRPRYAADVHPHEPEARMSIPVIVLAVGSLAVGWLWVELGHLTSAFSDYLAPVLARPMEQAEVLAGTSDPTIIAGVSDYRAEAAGAVAEPTHAAHPAWQIWLLAAAGVAVALVGWVVAMARYRHAPHSDDTRPLRGFGAAWTWGFDRVYHGLLVRPLLVLARVLDVVVDRALIGGTVAGVGYLTGVLGSGYRWFQRRQLRVSLAISVAAVVLIVFLIVADVLAMTAPAAAVEGDAEASASDTSLDAVPSEPSEKPSEKGAP